MLESAPQHLETASTQPPTCTQGQRRRRRNIHKGNLVASINQWGLNSLDKKDCSKTWCIPPYFPRLLGRSLRQASVREWWLLPGSLCQLRRTSPDHTPLYYCPWSPQSHYQYKCFKQHTAQIWSGKNIQKQMLLHKYFKSQSRWKMNKLWKPNYPTKIPGSSIYILTISYFRVFKGPRCHF